MKLTMAALLATSMVFGSYSDMPNSSFRISRVLSDISLGSSYPYHPTTHYTGQPVGLWKENLDSAIDKRNELFYKIKSQHHA
jgi:hypothetical protein